MNGTPLYLVTSTRDRKGYYIYKKGAHGVFERLGKAKTPPECYKRFAKDVYDLLQEA